MTLRDEFKTFILRGNVVDLAVGVVVGGAFGKIVTALVDGLVMPLVGLLLPSGDWKAWMAGPFKVGSVLGAIVDFMLIALVIFLVLVKGLPALARLRRKPEEAPAPTPATRTCPECLSEVPALAKRCRHCTSPLA